MPGFAKQEEAMRTSRWVRVIGGVCAGIAWAACGSEGAEDPGAIQVTWRLGGKSCADLGVETVRVSVRDSKEADVLDPPPTFPCAEGKGEVSDVPPGTYTLVLEGVTTDGHPDYQGTRTGVRVESGKVTTVSPTVNLELKKSEVLLNWEFPQGTGHCNGNQVAQVEVSVYDSAASTVVPNAYHPCLLPVETYPDLGVLIPDLRGNEELTFFLYGLNNQSPPQQTHHGRKTVTTVPGERSSVNVMLEPCPGPDQCP